MDVVLGIDGGGTHTRAHIWDVASGQRSAGEAKGCNPVSVGRETACQRLDEAITAAFGHWSGAAPRLRALHAGIAGAGHPELAQALGDHLSRRWNVARARVQVSHDLLTAWCGALGGQPGVLLIAGTGSAGYARGPAGEEHRCGGWGHRLDDRGSGYALGLGGLRAALDAQDGLGPETALSQALTGALGLTDWRELPGLLATQTDEKAFVAHLAPLVVSLAPQDAVADRLVQAAVADLVRMAEVLAKRLGPATVWPVTTTGGLSISGYFGDCLQARFQHSASLKWVDPLGSPIDGALTLASRT